MSNIKNYTQFNKLNEANAVKIKLTEDEKKFIWSKLEYNKKNKAKESESDVFNLLTSEGTSSITTEELIKYLNMLEYNIKKKLKDPEYKFRNKDGISLKNKLPEMWVGVKYSSLSAKDVRDKKEKEENSKKDDKK